MTTSASLPASSDAQVSAGRQARGPIRIKPHPGDENAAVIFAGPEWAQTMGRFGPARWIPEQKAFLLHVDQLVRFRQFIEREGGYIVTESTSTRRAWQSAPECAACGQPGSSVLSEKLRICPACGQPWVPVVWDGAEQTKADPECTICGRHQTGTFAFCGHCGSRMPDPSSSSGHPLPTDVREQLAAFADSLKGTEA